MAIEIERKFLVDISKWQKLEKPEGEKFRQGYLMTEKSKSIRIRQTPKTAFLTIKSGNQSLSRLEFEYEIPIQDATEILNQLAIAELSKIRYKVEFKGKIWEVDEFLDKNQGLIVAEIELNSETENFQKPDWIGMEVTEDEKYLNANLVLKPYCEWI